MSVYIIAYKSQYQKNKLLNQKIDREIKGNTHLSLHEKMNKKNLRINLFKEAKKKKNCKTRIKEIKDNVNRWKDIPCS